MKKIALSILLLSLMSVSILHAQISEKAEDISPLLCGEIIPDMYLINMDGKVTSTHYLFKEKPTVLIFYRGGWCPYCNEHLAEIGKLEEEIVALGYQILAVSPDGVPGLEETGLKNELKYELLSDATGVFTQAVGIAFKAPDQYEKRLFEVSNGQNKGFLPVPSVFVLDEKGEILFEHINPNYRTRLKGELLMAVLKALKKNK
jgi:peroxiredoxin